MIEIYRAVRKRGLDPIVASHGGQYEFLLRQEQVPHIRLKPFFSNERAEKFISINRMEAVRLKAAEKPYDGAEAIADNLFRVSTGVSSHS